MGELTEEQVKEVIEFYDSENMQIIGPLLGMPLNGLDTVATVTEKWAFVYHFKRWKEGKPFRTEAERMLVMCDEYFRFCDGKKADDRPLYEVSTDIILNVPTRPFLCIAEAGKVRDYINSQSRLEQELEHSELRMAKNTNYILYDLEVFRNVTPDVFFANMESLN